MANYTIGGTTSPVPTEYRALKAACVSHFGTGGAHCSHPNRRTSRGGVGTNSTGFGCGVPGNFWLKATQAEMHDCLVHDSLSYCPIIATLMWFLEQVGVDGLRFAGGGSRTDLGVTKGDPTPLYLPLEKSTVFTSHPNGVWVLGPAAVEAWNAAPAVTKKKRTKRAPAKKKTVTVTPASDPALLSPIQQVRLALNERYIERGYEVQLLLVAAVSRAHLFFLGPPGTGKTEMIQDFAKCLGVRVFDTLLSAGTSREEIEGPLDVSLLKDTGEQRRRRGGYITNSTLAVLDEIWKSSPFLLNSLLRLMSQRSYFEEGAEHKAKTRCVFAASNETPQDSSLGALYSRFTLRSYTDYIVTAEGRAMLCGYQEWKRPEVPQHLLGRLSEADLDIEREKALTLPLTKGFSKAMQETLKALEAVTTGPRTRGIVLDDRRLRLLTEVAQVWAHLDGQTSVGPEYALILADTAWDTHKERTVVEDTVYNRASVSKVVTKALSLGDEVLRQRTASLLEGDVFSPPENAPAAQLDDHRDKLDDVAMGTIESLVIDRIKKAVLKATQRAN